MNKIISFISRIGENPKFIVANAHTWFAFFAIAILVKFLPLWLAFSVCLLIAGVKEFWFDLRYETMPKQTFLDSLTDFVEYIVGLLVALMYFY